MDIKRETNHLRGLAKVLTTLAKEVDNKNKFDNTDIDLLKKVGSDILFQGISIDWRR
jgi:hypothetical protein